MNITQDAGSFRSHTLVWGEDFDARMGKPSHQGCIKERRRHEIGTFLWVEESSKRREYNRV